MLTGVRRPKGPEFRFSLLVGRKDLARCLRFGGRESEEKALYAVRRWRLGAEDEDDEFALETIGSLSWSRS